MSTTQPIRDEHTLKIFKNYYREVERNPRNYTLIVMGLNTALRINDILHITWGMVYDFQNECLQQHLELKEQKTGKMNRIAINESLEDCLTEFLQIARCQMDIQAEHYIFLSRKGTNRPISRIQAFRIIKKAAIGSGFQEHISCHSLRKTFGYYAWKHGIPPAILMNIYNHSSFQVTKRYLGIEQDDKDDVFLKVTL